MRYSIRTVTPASALPISVAEAKAHLRIEAADTSEDGLVAALIAAAVDHVERFTSHVLADCELEMAMDRFPWFPELIAIPREPVTGIVSLIYTGVDGAAVTVDPGDYRWSVSSPDNLLPAFGAAWPSAACERGSVRLRFNAGYADGEAPPALLAAAKLMVGHLYGQREAVVAGPTAAAIELPLGVASLCAPLRRIVI